MWTANLERFCKVLLGLSETAESLLRTFQLGLEVLPSTLSRVASILKGCAFLGGYSQTTPVPGTLELTWQCRVFVGGDDYQSGQTKLRFMLTDILIVSGLKTLSILNYSHLATMTGRTRRRQHSSAPRRCPRAAWYTMCWYTASQRSTCRARSQVTAWSSGTWATASVSWISTQQSGCWAVLTGWNCTTHSRTRSWPIPSRRTWSRCQTMPAHDPLHRCQPRATELPTGAVAAPLGFLLQAQLGRWGSPVANPLFRQHTALNAPSESAHASGARDEAPCPRASWACGHCLLCLARREQCPPPPVALLVTPNGHSQAEAPQMPTT